MDISLIDASKKSTSGITLKIRDPRVKRNPDVDEDTRPYLLSNPDDLKSIVTIDILGPDHPRVARLLAPQRARYMQQALMTQSRKGVKVTADEIASEEAENLEIAIAATRAWQGWSNAGEEYECTPTNARELYTMSADVKEQVLNALRDRSSFLAD